MFTRNRVHDRMCTRACVCVNTFVRLSPFACPTCKYTRRHTRMTRVSTHPGCTEGCIRTSCRNVPRCQYPSNNNYASSCIDTSNSKYVSLCKRKAENVSINWYLAARTGSFSVNCKRGYLPLKLLIHSISSFFFF